MSKTHNNTFITRCYYVISFGPILYQHNLTSGDNSNTINVLCLNHLSAPNIGQKGFIFTDLLSMLMLAHYPKFNLSILTLLYTVNKIN